MNDTYVIAKRSLSSPIISVGEKVDVFIHKLFVTKGEKVFALTNQAIKEESIII